MFVRQRDLKSTDYSFFSPVLQIPDKTSTEAKFWISNLKKEDGGKIFSLRMTMEANGKKITIVEREGCTFESGEDMMSVVNAKKSRFDANLKSSQLKTTAGSQFKIQMELIPDETGDNNSSGPATIIPQNQRFAFDFKIVSILSFKIF